jgi:hypothetical protein
MVCLALFFARRNFPLTSELGELSMGFCNICGETYREWPDFYTCGSCKEKELNQVFFGISITDFELLRLIKSDDLLVYGVKRLLKEDDGKEN